MTEHESRRLSGIKPNLERRARIYESTRRFFRDAGFLEVDTPVRASAVAPEMHIIPFESEDWYLAASPELYMKRLLAAGYDRIFQICRCFRKGERGRLHNPEFSMLEWYRTGAGYMDMIEDTEHLVNAVAEELKVGSRAEFHGKTIDITPPWQRITVQDAFMEAAGWDPGENPDPLRFDEDLVARVIPSFPEDRPVVIMDYPAAMASLSRLKPDNPAVAERAEVFIGSLELANAFSELTDAEEQARRFREEAAEIEKQTGNIRPLPGAFLDALKELPECGGIALGMDRLVMLFCNASSIDEVMPFTSDTA